MFKSGFAFILSAVMVVTNLAPATAQAAGHKSNEDAIGALLFGALAIYAISEISKKDKPPVAAYTHKNAPKAKRKPRPNRYVIPARCLRRFETHNGIRRGVKARCVDRFAPRVSLPDRCLRRLRTVNGKRMIYGKKCLRKNGYLFG